MISNNFILYAQLFYEFCKTGLFAVGGGLATLPFLQAMGRRTGWFTMQDIADMVAVSESTPGPMGVNSATYVGYRVAGLPGGIIATLGLITPSIIIILLIAKILEKFRNSMIVGRIFWGLRAASTALILTAGIGVARIALLQEDLFRQTGHLTDLFNGKLILLAAIIWVLYTLGKKKSIHPILYIAGAAAAGIIFSL